MRRRWRAEPGHAGRDRTDSTPRTRREYRPNQARNARVRRSRWNTTDERRAPSGSEPEPPAAVFGNLPDPAPARGARAATPEPRRQGQPRRRPSAARGVASGAAPRAGPSPRPASRAAAGGGRGRRRRTSRRDGGGLEDIAWAGSRRRPGGDDRRQLASRAIEAVRGSTETGAADRAPRPAGRSRDAPCGTCASSGTAPTARTSPGWRRWSPTTSRWRCSPSCSWSSSSSARSSRTPTSSRACSATCRASSPPSSRAAGQASSTRSATARPRSESSPRSARLDRRLVLGAMDTAFCRIYHVECRGWVEQKRFALVMLVVVIPSSPRASSSPSPRACWRQRRRPPLRPRRDRRTAERAGLSRRSGHLR